MGQAILYGVPTETLEDVVREYMIQQGNHRRNHEAEYMITAYEVWMELFRSTIWTMQYKILEVDKANNTVQMPCNAERIIGLSIMDECDNMRPIGYNPNMMTLQVTCHKETCSCETCNGEGTLCDAIDSITYRTEIVVIDTVPYDKKIWNRKSGCNLIEVTETPVKDGDAITYLKQERIVCDLEVNDEGCIKVTEANKSLISTHCGCFIPSCHVQMVENACRQQKVRNEDGPILPANRNSYGYYKPDAICDGLWHLHNVTAEKVIVSYQLSATTDLNNQINVPVYAKNAVKFGMMYWGLVFKPRATAAEKRDAETMYKKAKRHLQLYMNPINIYEFMQVPKRRIQW